MIFCIGKSYGQLEYKGKIIDAQNGKVIPYVNIGIIGKGVGTVSDEEGLFHLEIDPKKYSSNDTLLFSSLGYKTLKKSVPQLQFVYNEYPEILMLPEQLSLKEVVVTDKGSFPVNEMVGYQNFGEKIYGYWKGNIALGGQLGTSIKVKKGLRRLNNLFFEVKENPSDSILVRVNIYDEDGNNNAPGTNLNRSNKSILHTIPAGVNTVNIDLSPNEIFVKNDFIVSLELVKIYGTKPIGLVLAAARNRYTDSYRRYASQASWEKLNDAAMAYSLSTTYYSKKGKGDSKVLKGTRKQKAKELISGFVFFNGRQVSGVKVVNYRTNEETLTDAKGRYTIMADMYDFIGFEYAQGKQKRNIMILKKRTININLDQ